MKIPYGYWKRTALIWTLLIIFSDFLWNQTKWFFRWVHILTQIICSSSTILECFVGLFNDYQTLDSQSIEIEKFCCCWSIAVKQRNLLQLFKPSHFARKYPSHYVCRTWKSNLIIINWCIETLITPHKYK